MTESAAADARAQAIVAMVRRGELADASALLAERSTGAAGSAGQLAYAEAVLAAAQGRSEVAYQAASRAIAQLAPTPELAETYALLSELRLAVGDTNGALAAADRAAKTAQLHCQPLDQARIEANLALVEKQAGRYRQAAVRLEAAGRVFSQFGSPAEVANWQLNMAALLVDVGRSQKALALAQRATAAFAALGQREREALARWAAAAAAQDLRLYEDAHRAYSQAAEMLVELDRFAEAAAIQVNVADVLRRVGRLDLAREALRRAEAALGGAPPAHRSAALVARAHIEQSLGHVADCAEVLDACERLTDSAGLTVERAEAGLVRARLLLSQGRPAEARAVALAACETMRAGGSSQELALAQLHLGDIALASGETAAAATAYRAVLQEAATAAPDLRWRAWHGLLGTAVSAADPTAALDYGLAAIEALEALAAGVQHDLLSRPFDDAPEHGRLFTDVLAVCAGLGDAETAMAVLQRGKSRVLVERLGGGAAVPVADAAWRDREQTAQCRVHECLAALTRDRPDPATRDRLISELDAAEMAWLELQLELDGGSGVDPARSAIAPALVGAVAVAGHLGPETALVDYYCHEADLVVCAVGEAGQTLQYLPGRAAEVWSALDRYEANLAMLAQTPPELFEQVLPRLQVACDLSCAELHDLVLGPVTTVTDSARRLLISPHGRLWGVPWAALHDGLEPLLDRCEIGLLPASSALPRLAALPPGRGHGNLVVAGSAERLAAAGTELAAVARSLGPGQTVQHPDREQLLAQLPQARLFHFSGHAEYQPHNPLFSSLILAGGDRLAAADLYQCQLRADLVTLAACETGRSDSRSAAGLMGLARAFLHAGARTVVAALWPAPDVATAALMTAFYGGYRSGCSPAAALRQAQMEVRRQTVHPFYWAGFSIVGQPWLVPAPDEGPQTRVSSDC